MKNYSLFVSAHDEQLEQQLDFAADSPASVFDWVERNAPGHDFELFEDGRSLGRVSYASKDEQ